MRSNLRVSGRVTAFSSTWNPPRKRTRQIRHNCVRKCLVNASTQAGLSLRKKESRRGKEMRGVARYCEPFVEYSPREQQSRSPRKFTTVLCRTSIRLRGERSTASPVSNLSISQPTAAKVGAMSPMRLLRFHDGGSQDRMGYPQVVHFRHLQTADFISKLAHSVQSRMLYPNSVIA